MCVDDRLDDPIAARDRLLERAGAAQDVSIIFGNADDDDAAPMRALRAACSKPREEPVASTH